MTTILGPNGSGKTTLFKCITGIWHPRQGAVLFGEQDLLSLSYSRRAGIIAVVPQDARASLSLFRGGCGAHGQGRPRIGLFRTIEAGPPRG